jgi:tape measure domain-containing protein
VATLGRLTTVFDAETAKFKAGTLEVQKGIAGVEKSLTSLSGSTRGFAAGLLPGLASISEIIQGIPQIGRLAGGLIRPLTDAAEEGIRLNMVLETAKIGFEGVAGSAQKSQKHIEALMAFGKASPFRFEGLLEASRFMTAFGFSLDEQIPKLTIWGNALAASGELSASKVQDVVRAFGQMRTAGRVNAQDMNQLTNANIPGWELLAKAIGKTVEQTRKLSEAGKLEGKAAVEAITAMMALDPRFKNMMKRMEATGAGRLSAAQDVIQFAQAKATASLTQDISTTLGAALQKENLVGQLAGTINSAIAPVSALIKTAAIGLLGGGLTSGFIEGIQAGKDAVKQAVGDFALDGIIGTAKGWLGIHSASTVFKEMGLMSALGFTDGFAEGLYNGAFDDIIERFLGHVEGRLSKAQKRSAENLAKLMEREPEFKPKLIRESQRRGINPDHLLNVMAVETAGSFSPAVKNPNSSASGLIQFMADTARSLGTSTAELRKMSATKQLDFVFKYFDDFIKRGHDLSTQGALYAVVGAGRVGRNDQSVLMTRNNPGYAGNAATWDPNRDGIVRQGEMALAAFSKLGAGINFTIGGSPVTATNPVPVTVVMAPMGGRTGRRSAGGTQPDVDVSFDDNSIQIADPFQRLMARSSPLTTGSSVGSSVASMTRLLPKALQDTKELSAVTEQAAKGMTEVARGAGDWAKVVIRGTDSLADRLRDFRDSLPTLRESMDDIFMDLPQGIGNLFGDAVRQWDGTMKGFLASLTQGVSQTLSDISAMIASSAIKKAVAGLLGSLGDASKGGGFWSGLLRTILGGVAGGAAGGGVGATASFTPRTIGSSIAIPGFRATGGPVSAMSPYIVGERGPEMFVPQVSGNVIPNNKMGQQYRQATNNSSGNTYHININIPDSRAADSYKSPRSRRELATQIAATLQGSLR